MTQIVDIIFTITKNIWFYAQSDLPVIVFIDSNGLFNALKDSPIDNLEIQDYIYKKPQYYKNCYKLMMVNNC